jgi:hypothetical protein
MAVLRDRLNEGGPQAIRRVTKRLDAQTDACWPKGLRLGALHGRVFNMVLVNHQVRTRCAICPFPFLGGGPCK